MAGTSGRSLIQDSMAGTIHKKNEYIKKLEAENAALRDGSCRFNCRSMRAMFIIGYREAIANQDIEGDIRVTPEQAYDEWRDENERT